VRLHWESEGRVEWAHVGGGYALHVLHVLRNDGRWNWYAMSYTGS
jgi:hypothetical protein